MWENRLIQDKGARCKITVDGTDFCINKQRDEPTSWYSFKFKSAAVRYELGVAIQSGFIVWASRPFRAGRYPDITIFRLSGLKQKLLDAGEKAEADQGYCGEPNTISLPDEASTRERLSQKSIARARHETCNKRFKTFNVLAHQFRHDVDFHEKCFYAVVVLVQLMIREGIAPLFEITYTDEGN